MMGYKQIRIVAAPLPGGGFVHFMVDHISHWFDLEESGVRVVMTNEDVVDLDCYDGDLFDALCEKADVAFSEVPSKAWRDQKSQKQAQGDGHVEFEKDLRG